MKKKFSSILGVGLALVLAFTMAGGAFLAAPAPEAEAATLAWSTFGIPSKAGNVLVADGEDLGPVAPSPNFSTDNTVFAAVNLAGAETVYKSVDGGHTWTASSTNIDEVIVALVVSNQYASDSTVVAATQDNVYRSEDGGATFSALGGDVSGTTATVDITCLDISPNYDGVGVIAVGLSDTRAGTTPADVDGAETEVKVWGADGALNWTDFGMSDSHKQVDITAVKFSPNYAIDSALLAVGSANSTSTDVAVYPGTKLYTRSGDNEWDELIGGPTTVASAVCDMAGDGTGILLSSIALPSDYDGTKSTLRRAYVSIVSDLGAVANADDVYRVTNITAGVDTGLDQQLSNIDYSGDFADGTIVGGLYRAAVGEAEVYNTTNPTAATVDWYATSNPPSGEVESANTTTCWVAMDKDFATSSIVFAGTLDVDSAFAVSYDAADNWTETGLIDNNDNVLEVLGGLALSSNYATDETAYLLAQNSADGSSYDTSLWRTENAGTYWDRVHFRDYATAGTGIIAISGTYATDGGVVYIGDTSTRNLSYSANKGESWSNRTIASGRGVEINSMVAPDATTLYVGDANSGTIAKSTNSGYVWSAGDTVPTGGGTLIASIAVEDSVVVVGDGAGSVLKSTDAGASWSQVATTVSGGGNMYVTFSGDTIYVADDGTTDEVYRFVTGDADWTDINAGLGAAIGLILAADGTLYASDSAATASQQVRRSINPTKTEPTPGVDWEWMDGPGVTTSAMSVSSLAVGNEVAIIETTGTPSVQVYSDTISLGTAGPTLVSPVDGTVVTTGTSFTAKFEAITNALTYDVYVSRDPDFSYTDDKDTVTAPSTQKAMTLQEAATNYWMVRVATPLLGAWSEVWSVEAQVISPVVAPTPQSPGAWSGTTTDVAVEPVLNWSAFKYATGYEVQLASDTEFSADSLIADLALGNVTSWKCTTTLDNDTTYYWKVRAITATATSDWSNVVGFTTEAVPTVWTCSFCGDTFATEAELAAHIAAEHPTVPTTPSYVWAIIGIGAVLVIAVIVLITRTRRVV